MRRVITSYRAAYAGVPAAVWRLSWIALVHRSGSMVLPFLLLFLEKDRAFDTDHAGWLASGYGAGGILGGLAAGAAIRRFGPRRVLAGSLVLTALFFVVVERLHGPLELALGLFLLGFAAESFRPPITTMVGENCTPEQRAQAFGLLRLAINLGVTIGSAVGGIVAKRGGYGWLFWLDGLTCLAAAALVLQLLPRDPNRSPEQRAEAKQARRAGSPWRDPVFLVFLVCITGFALLFLQLLSSVPLYWTSCGLDEEAIGYLYAVNPVLIVLFEMPLLAYLRRGRPLPWVALGGVFLAAGFAVLPMASSPSVGLAFAVGLGAMLLWTMGEMLESALNTSFVSQRADRGDRGSYMGLQSVAFSTALVAAPTFGTSIMTAAGPQTLWWTCTGLGLVLAGVIAWLDRVVRREASDQTDAPGSSS